MGQAALRMAIIIVAVELRFYPRAIFTGLIYFKNSSLDRNVISPPIKIFEYFHKEIYVRLI